MLESRRRGVGLYTVGGGDALSQRAGDGGADDIGVLRQTVFFSFQKVAKENGGAFVAGEDFVTVAMADAAAAAVAVAVGNQQEMGVPSLSFGFDLFKNGGVFGVGRRDGGKGSVGFFL